MMSTQYCLFFSFKGGVGRTSAMMNTALHLAKMKKRVMCIDLDLPAPGIDVFDRVEGAGKPSYNPTKYMFANDMNAALYKQQYGDGHIPLDAEGIGRFIDKAPGGFLEFCRDYLNAIKEGNPYDEDLPQLFYPGKLKDRFKNYHTVKDKDKYLYRLPKNETIEGDIIMMRVGNHDDADAFDKLLASIDVNYLDPELSIPMEERSMKDQPEFVRHLKREIEEKIQPDYVLVDGRPSMDPISRFAMSWFGNCIVLAFNLNPWNLSGIIGVYQKLALNSPSQRGHSNILLLASPIPEFAQRSDLYTDQFNRIKQKMNMARNSGEVRSAKPVEVPQTDVLLLRDVLICDIEPYHPACRAYMELAQLIVAGNTQDVKNAIDKALEQNSESEKLIEFDHLETRYHRMNEAVANEHGKIYLRQGREKKALEQFERAWAIIEDQRMSLDETAGNDAEVISPYILDTAYQMVETIRIIATKNLEALARKGKLMGEEKDKTITSQLSALETAIARLQKVKIQEGNDEFKKIKDQGFAPFIALEANILFLMAKYLMEQNSPKYKEKLEEALAYFGKAIELSPKKAEYYFGRAEVNLSLVELGDKEKIETSIKDFEAAAENRTGFAAAMLKAGQYYFSLAIRLQGPRQDIVHFPAFSVAPPFVEQSPNQVSHDHQPFIYVGDIDPVNGIDYLKKAEKKLKDAVDKQPDLELAYFYLGLIELVKTTTLNGRELDIIEKYKSAQGHFNNASLYRPSFAPAYFYNGLTQFLLNDLSRDKDPRIDSISFRQAFYRMEHFIQLNFTKLVSTRNIPPQKIKDRKPFYFDGTPGKDIDQIETAIKDGNYDFPFTLEIASGFPSVVKILRPTKNDMWQLKYIKMIEEKIYLK